MSKEIMQNMLQEIVTHFGKNPRELRSVQSHEHGGCLYHPNLELTPKSIGCAIGMYLDWDVAKKLDGGSSVAIGNIFEGNRKQLLPEWMQKLDVHFLKKCQRLHDYMFFWNEKGISDRGKEEVKEICKQFKLKPIKF